MSGFKIEQRGALKIYSLVGREHSYSFSTVSDKIKSLSHSSLTSTVLDLLNSYFANKPINALEEIGTGLLGQLIKQQMCSSEVQEGQLAKNIDVNNELEEISRLIKSGVFPLLQEPLEDLRSLFLRYVYPETGGKFISLCQNGQQVCRCNGVSHEEIEHFIEENSEASILEINDELGVGVGCGSCQADVNKIFDYCLKSSSLTAVEWMIKVDRLLQSKVSKNWGTFKGCTDSELIIELRNIDKSDFVDLTRREVKMCRAELIFTH